MEENGILSEREDHQVLDIMGDRLEPNGGHFSFVLSFTNLTYSLNSAGTTKAIIRNVSGEAREGEIFAVLGASGSGKSTLLDALANRIAKESLEGHVALNGEPLDSRLSRAIAAYVMQDDMLFPMLTVEETLTYAAEFRLPRELAGASKRKERVQALIDQLGLRTAANTIIGHEGNRGVSGGERRRVSIGVDIIHDPILLFLDEPTSGLDSTSAFTVVKVLKRIARGGSVVLLSIHQPSFRIVELVDRMILLSRGEVVFGGTPRKLGEFFSDFGQPVPVNANGVDFALDLISELENSRHGIQSLVEFNKSWQNRNIDSGEAIPLREALKWAISRGKLMLEGILDGRESV